MKENPPLPLMNLLKWQPKIRASEISSRPAHLEFHAIPEQIVIIKPRNQQRTGTAAT